ncbi:MAG: hypothetical protein ABIL77_02650 [candidate division WOR-3 bacterium]
MKREEGMVEQVQRDQMRDNVTVLLINGLKVGVCRNLKEHWKVFKEKKIDLIVEGWRDKTVVVRNDLAKDKVDLKRLQGRYPVLKILESGFKAVIDLPLESVSVFEIVKTVKKSVDVFVVE